MTETDIYNELKALADGNVFPYVAPAGAPHPWLVFSIISDTKTDVLAGHGATVTSVQIDTYSTRIDEARQLSNLAEYQLSLYPLTDVSRTASYETDTQLYRVMFEFRIWH